MVGFDDPDDDDDDDQEDNDAGPSDPHSAKAINQANAVAAFIIEGTPNVITPGKKMSHPFQHIDKPIPIASCFIIDQGQHKLMPFEDPPV